MISLRTRREKDRFPRVLHTCIVLVRSHRLLSLTLGAFVVLGIVYSVVTPIFEAGDEIWHYPFVQSLATGHGLPIQDPAVKTLWEQEGGQPPLFYALAALATAWVDTRDLPERLWLNPHARIGIPLLSGNKNLIVHTSAESFPWHDTALAVHLIRLLSLLFSAATVALTYALALEVKPGDKKLAAAASAVVALNPMFLFISASVNNDSLAVMLATLSLLLLVQLVTRGATIRRFIVLGVVLGLAALSKVSDAGLLVVAALVFAYLLWREVKIGRGRKRSIAEKENEPRPMVVLSQQARTIFTGSILCAGLVVAIAGWWYLRNWLLYGDPLAFNVWVQIAGGRPNPVTPLGLLSEFQGFRISFWGNFGGVNLIAPDWVYVLLDAVSLLAAVGLFIGLFRRTLAGLLALPALWFAIVSISLVRWTLLTLASQGRLIFPAIAAVAILFVHGLEQFQVSGFRPQTSRPPARFQLRRLGVEALAGLFDRNSNKPAKASTPSMASYVLGFGFWVLRFPYVLPVAFLLAFTALAPFVLISPAYALPPRLPANASVPNPVHIDFEGRAELVGYDLPQASVMPGAELPLTLYWKAIAPMDEDLSVYIRLLDNAGHIVGRWDAFPGNGLYPTRLWQPNEMIVDSYRVPVTPDAPGAEVGRIEAGLFRRMPLENLTARDPQGNVITPSLGRFKIAGRNNITIENPVEIRFGERIALVGYGFGKTVAPGSSWPLRLYWRALEKVNEDYTVFVHLVNSGGVTVAQQDNPPRRGAFPTLFWDAGDIIPDDYALGIPPDTPMGEYAVQIGMYRPGDSTRLPVRDGDSLVLATVSITR